MIKTYIRTEEVANHLHHCIFLGEKMTENEKQYMEARIMACGGEFSSHTVGIRFWI